MRKEAIHKWKEDVRDVLMEKSEREAESDFEGHSNLVALIKAKLNESEASPEAKKDFEEKMKEYLAKVESHEMYGK